MAVNPAMYSSSRRSAVFINVGLFALAVLVIALIAAWFGHREAFRMRFDSTKTRAYSLSDQTRRMMEQLEGEWRIVVIVVEGEVDRAAMRQADEVLRRFAQAAPDLTYERIDPSDPDSFDRYEALISHLRGAYAVELAAYEQAIAQGRIAFDEWLQFSAAEVGGLQNLIDRLPANLPATQALLRNVPFISLMAVNGREARQEVERSMLVNEAQPLPDYEGARSTLTAYLLQSAQTANEVAAALTALRTLGNVDQEIRQFAEQARPRFEQMVRLLAGAADPLRHLPGLELAVFSRQLRQGETAVIIGPNGAATIPSGQLFPRANFQQSSEGVVTFDQRFRGEQVVASTIRSMLVGEMPLVVFVHAMPNSMLANRNGRWDLVGVHAQLRASRFTVREWIIGQTERPAIEAGRKVVWVVVPTPLVERMTPQPTREESVLYAEVERLLTAGESVLLSYEPNAMQRLRQPDPWPRLVRPYGVEVQTDRIVYQSLLVEGTTRASRPDHDILETPWDHPIARATDGQRILVGLPVPVQVRADAPADLRASTLVAIAPGPTRWIEPNWSERGGIIEPTEGDDRLFTEPAAIALAVARTHPDPRRGEQRLVVVGSGSWMHSVFADVTQRAGGERMVLVSPGNFELLQASVLWLAGLDDIIAQSPLSRQVARLEGITPAARVRWGVLTILVLPIGCLVFGCLVWVLRRF